MASTLNTLNLQPAVLPSFGGSQTEPNVTYVNSEGPILPLEQTLDPSSMIEIDRNSTTDLENYIFAAYTLEEISQPTNNTSINLLYNVEPNNLPRDVNGSIIIDQNTNEYQGKVLTINLSANRYYREEFDRIVDVEFTQLISPVNTLNVQDILNENQSLKDLVALLQLQNNELQQSNTQLADGTLIRSAQQNGYYAIIDKGKRRWFAFNEQLVQSVEATNGRTLIDIDGEIIINIPQGSDYRVEDFTGTGVTVVNTHPNNLYVLGILDDPFAAVSTNTSDIVNRQWRVTEFNFTPENGAPILGTIPLNYSTASLSETRRAIAFAADQVLTNGSGVIPDPNMPLNFNTDVVQANISNPDIIVWAQNTDGSLSILATGFTYVITANFWTAQLGNENVLSIRFNYDTYSITYKCVEVENTATPVTAPTTTQATNTISQQSFNTPPQQSTAVPFFGTDWYVQSYAVNFGNLSGSVNPNVFSAPASDNYRLIRFETGGSGILPKFSNFNSVSPNLDVDTCTWITGTTSNNIIATITNPPNATYVEDEADITWQIDNNGILTIELLVNGSLIYTYTCTTTP